MAKDAESESVSSFENVHHRPHEAEELVGRSSEILKVGKMIGQAASSDAPILLTGETGTGKELLARIVHRNSRRKDEPFVVVNCAHLSPEILELELFGRGEKTDGSSEPAAKLELCRGGTILLDDIGSMGLSTQNKLLTFLKKVEIGAAGNQTVKVSPRIIASSSRDLSKSVSEGKFMQELFYNLRVISIPVPPLRERKSDVPLLAHYFLKRYRERDKKVAARISADAMKLFMACPWPGNVGELENNIYSAVVMCQSEEILPEHLPIFYEGRLEAQIDLQQGKDDYSHLLIQTLDPIRSKLFHDLKGKVHHRLIGSLEKALISMALKHCQGNQVKAAHLLGLNRNTLRERILRFRLRKKETPSK